MSLQGPPLDYTWMWCGVLNRTVGPRRRFAEKEVRPKRMFGPKKSKRSTLENDTLRMTPNNGKSKNMKIPKNAKNRFLRFSSKLEKSIFEILRKFEIFDF